MRRTTVNQRVLILCEGLTEYIYANDLKSSLPKENRNSISVEITYEQGGNPKNLLEKALSKRKKAIQDRNRYHEIWLFFDNDNCENISELFKKINAEGIKYAYSSLCIEHWFIIHFQKCGRAFQSGEEAEKYLKSIWKEYHKTSIRHYPLLISKLDTALQNAKILNNISEQNFDSLDKRNPYFTIPDLIEKFNNLRK